MSTSLPSLAITGSTGAVGGMVARSLAALGIPLRLLVRDPARAPELASAMALACTYGDVGASARALGGVETLLMISAAESVDRRAQHLAFVEAARAAGVKHVVYTSFQGAAADCTFTLGRDHWATEQAIRASGLRFTFLRDNLYLDFLPMLVGEDGVIRGPAGDGKAAVVARADVAAVATEVLRRPADHVDATHVLTGPEALDLHTVAALLSRARGAPVTYHDESIAEAYASRQKWGAPDWQNDAWVSTYTAIAKGELAAVSPDVERITGRPASSLEAFLGAGNENEKEARRPP